MSIMTQDVVQTATTDVPDEAAHIVLVPPRMKRRGITAQSWVMTARVEGFPITALCGHTWIPQRDPEPLPVCEPCLVAYRQPGRHRESRDELPEA